MDEKAKRRTAAVSKRVEGQKQRPGKGNQSTILGEQG